MLGRGRSGCGTSEASLKTGTLRGFKYSKSGCIEPSEITSCPARVSDRRDGKETQERGTRPRGPGPRQRDHPQGEADQLHVPPQPRGRVRAPHQLSRGRERVGEERGAHRALAHARRQG